MIKWFSEILKYDLNIVLRFWINGKDFMYEREKWKKSFIHNSYSNSNLNTNLHTNILFDSSKNVQESSGSCECCKSRDIND